MDSKVFAHFLAAFSQMSWWGWERIALSQYLAQVLKMILIERGSRMHFVSLLLLWGWVCLEAAYNSSVSPNSALFTPNSCIHAWLMEPGEVEVKFADRFVRLCEFEKSSFKLLYEYVAYCRPTQTVNLWEWVGQRTSRTLESGMTACIQ